MPINNISSSHICPTNAIQNPTRYLNFNDYAKQFLKFLNLNFIRFLKYRCEDSSVLFYFLSAGASETYIIINK